MRNIGDIVPIRDADELLVYFHKEECFYRINHQNFYTFFPKKEGANRCRTCPNFYVKYTGKLTVCQTKMENFSQFKTHLSETEKIFGELAAFKNGSKLPDKSNYKKHRMYGHLMPFQSKDEFFMYDTRKNQFIKMQKKDVTKTFTRKGICNFCPCNRKLQSSTTVIKHLQVLETRFFCYLILDDDLYNDAKNQERLNVYLNCIKTKEINSKVFSRRSNFTGNSRHRNNDNNSIDDESDYEESSSGEEGENSVTILNDFENAYGKNFEKINNYFGKLKGKICSTNLNQGIIDVQEQLNLIRRNEDFQTGEKEFTFIAKIALAYEDLDYLMNKYGITDDYEIDDANVTLNLKVKEEISINQDALISIQDSNEQLAITSPSRKSVNRRSIAVNHSPIREIAYENYHYEINNEAIENGNDESTNFDNNNNALSCLDDESTIDATGLDDNCQGSPLKENSPDNDIHSFDQIRIKQEKTFCDYDEEDEHESSLKRIKTS